MPSTSKPAAEKKLWGGRFTGDTDPLMVQFNESLPIDKRMWKEDIQVGFLPGSMLCLALPTYMRAVLPKLAWQSWCTGNRAWSIQLLPENLHACSHVFQA